MQTTFITAYGPKTRTAVIDFIDHKGNADHGLTQQQFQEECDINNIMKKYQTTGAITHFNDRSAEYGDASSEDFRDAMNTVVHAQNLFDALPSKIRSRFANDPSRFLDFVQDDKNAKEMAALGLIEIKKPPGPSEIETLGETLSTALKGDKPTKEANK